MRRAPLATLLLVAACGGGGGAPPEPAFDPKSPGPVEMPGEPMSEPFPWRPAAAAATVALVAAALVARRMRHAAPADDRPVASPPPVAGEGPRVRALQRIARLRAHPARTADDHAETASLVRDYVRDRFGVPAGERTTDELIVAHEIAADARRLLADVLRPCDLVKFAKDEPTDASRAALLDAAETFVRGTTAP